MQPQGTKFDYLYTFTIKKGKALSILTKKSEICP